MLIKYILFFSRSNQGLEQNLYLKRKDSSYRSSIDPNFFSFIMLPWHNYRLKKVNLQIEKFVNAHQYEVVAAFITFNKEESFNLCLKTYDLYSHGIYRYFTPKHLLFKNTKIKIDEAPEPSNIKYENLHISWLNRRYRTIILSIFVYEF